MKNSVRSSCLLVINKGKNKFLIHKTQFSHLKQHCYVFITKNGIPFQNNHTKCNEIFRIVRLQSRRPNYVDKRALMGVGVESNARQIRDRSVVLLLIYMISYNHFQTDNMDNQLPSNNGLCYVFYLYKHKKSKLLIILCSFHYISIHKITKN